MKHKTITKAGIVIVLLVLFTAFLSISSNNTINPKYYRSFETKVSKPPSFDVAEEGQPYFRYGLTDKNGSIIDNGSYIKVSDNESFESFMDVENYFGFECNFTIVVLDNFIQIPFSVDGKVMKQCTVTISNSDDIQIPVKISNILKGTHNLIFLIYVDTKITNPELRATNLDRAHPEIFDSYVSCKLLAGDNTQSKKVINTNELKIINAKDNKIYDYISIYKDESKKSYSIYAANLYENSGQYALLFFKDFIQQPLLENDTVAFFTLNTGDGVTIPFENGLDTSKENSAILVRLNSNTSSIEEVYFSQRILPTN